jgi:hypothetical protein
MTEEFKIKPAPCARCQRRTVILRYLAAGETLMTAIFSAISAMYPLFH